MTPAPRQKSPSTRRFAEAALVVLAAGAAAGTIAGFLGSLAWYLDLAAHFRVQYLAGLAACGLAFAGLRRRRLAAVCAVLAVVNVVPVVAVARGDLVPGPPDGTARLVLSNVLTGNRAPQRVVEYLGAQDADVLVLLEVDGQWLDRLRTPLSGYAHQVVEARADNFGIAVLSRFPLSGSDVLMLGPAGLPTIVTTVNTPSGAFDLIATHPMPPVGRARTRARDLQLEDVAEFIRTRTRPVVVAGDLNSTPWSAAFDRFLGSASLRREAAGVHPTWPARGPGLLRIPIDHVLVTQAICVHRYEVGSAIGSDHRPLLVDLSIRAAPP